MYQLQLTLETPAGNLALDEALLDAAVAGELAGEVLRLWEPAGPLVVLGRSSRDDEVRRDACEADGVPVLRRSSGGATIVTGPGCLMYAVILDRQSRPELGGVDRAHAYVLGRHIEALSQFAAIIARQGTSDLTIGGEPSRASTQRKFSGNSLRLKRDHLLYHGTILYDFPLDRLRRWLGRPARTPEYRENRSHEEFVANFPAPREEITAALLEMWQAAEPLAAWPQARTEQLVSERYATTAW